MRRSWAGRSAKVATLGVKVAGIQGNAPAADAELLPTSDLYLIDGQLRGLTALWHGVAEIEAYLVQVDRSRSSS